jgi:hypothetical protein
MIKIIPVLSLFIPIISITTMISTRVLMPVGTFWIIGLLWFGVWRWALLQKVFR